MTDDFEKRAWEFIGKRLLSEVGSANTLPAAFVAVALDTAKWARAEMQGGEWARTSEGLPYQINANNGPIGSSFDAHYKQELLAEIAQLRDDLKLKERSNKLLRDSNNELKDELTTSKDALRSSIKQAQDNIAAVRAQRDELKDELERLKAEKEKTINMAVDAAHDPIGAYLKAEIEIARLKAELERANFKLQTIDRQWADGTKELKLTAVADSAKLAKYQRALEQISALHENESTSKTCCKMSDIANAALGLIDGGG